MARLPEHAPIYEAAEHWRQRCLEGPGSVFTEESIWTDEALKDLEEHFVGDPIQGKGTFVGKLESQLEDASAVGVKLAAEMLWLMLIYPSNLTAGKKRMYARKVWGWSGDELPEKHDLLSQNLLKRGIGSPGQGYAAYRWKELQLFILMMQEWREMDSGRQESLLADPWSFAEWLDQLEDAQRRQFRHILLHLLFPDTFERISVTDHKRDITSAFDVFLPDEELSETGSDLVALDRELFAIRDQLAEELNQERLDFYEAPLNRGWHSPTGQPQKLSPLAALRHRGQIVLYGPPGTGKTYDAMELARRAIESAAFRERRGDFFTIPEPTWKQVLDRHIVRRQLHPAYSYEEFVVGLHITKEGGTEYRDGLLLRLVDRMETAESEDEEFGHLPFVLVLDEINRSDLARLLGEAFSALEDRGEEIMIPAPLETEAGERERSLRVPENLLVIGTMNLIDQSLEHVDFALRRRFAWFEHTFSGEAVLEVARSRWHGLVEERGLREDSWEQILPEIERLQSAARKLNEEIANYEYLGPQYVVGHTYFSETLPMVADMLEGRTRAKKNFLWRQSTPLPPLEALWYHHLKPLLEQYLAGLEADQREERLAEWEGVFLERPDMLDD